MTQLASTRVARTFVSAAIACLLSGGAAFGESLADYVSRQVLGGRYMSPPGACTPGDRDLLGWPADLLLRCRYEVTDVHGDGSRHAKIGLVYLANPPPERVLAWLSSACRKASADDVYGCVRSEARAIRAASGAQFPVAGLVWEDQACGSPLGHCREGADGINEGYVFRNGVTVRVTGFANGSTDAVGPARLELLATGQQVTGIRRSGGYARILSTSRSEFAAFAGRADVPVGEGSADAAIAWSDLVGDLYRQALSEDDNSLLTASICVRRGMPGECKIH